MLMLRVALWIRIFSLCLSPISWLVSISCLCCIRRVLEEVAKPLVSRLCMEVGEFIVMGKWLELASLMITSAELIFSKVFEKALLCNLQMEKRKVVCIVTWSYYDRIELCYLDA